MIQTKNRFKFYNLKRDEETERGKNVKIKPFSLHAQNVTMEASFYMACVFGSENNINVRYTMILKMNRQKRKRSETKSFKLDYFMCGPFHD